MVVKVTKAVNDLTVQEKGAASSTATTILMTGGQVQGGLSLGQEGRGHTPSLPASLGAASDQVVRTGGPLVHASLGQEGQGLAVRGASNKGVQQLG